MSADPLLPKQALTIQGSRTTRVTLEDPALVVRVGDQAERIFPLDRLSQITTEQRVEWSSAALFACAERGIVVTVRDSRGGVVGRLIGREQQPLGWLQQLHDRFDEPKGEAAYRHWLKQQLHKIQWQLAQRWPLGTERQMHYWIQFGHWNTSFRQQIRRWCGSERVQQQVEAQWHHACQSAVLLRLQQEGYGAAWSAVWADRLDLVGDLTQMVLWGSYPPLLAGLRAASQQANRSGRVWLGPDEPALHALFQSAQPLIERQIQAALWHLQRWLAHHE